MYYRLTIVDEDGSYNESKTVSVTSLKENASAVNRNVFPNQFSEDAFVSIDLAENTTVKTSITDITGKTISTQEKVMIKGIISYH